MRKYTVAYNVSKKEIKGTIVVETDNEDSACKGATSFVRKNLKLSQDINVETNVIKIGEKINENFNNIDYEN